MTKLSDMAMANLTERLYTQAGNLYDFFDEFDLDFRNMKEFFKEKNKIRLNQHLKFLNYVHVKTAPDNAIVIYFLAYVQFKLFKKINNSLINKIIFAIGIFVIITISFLEWNKINYKYTMYITQKR